MKKILTLIFICLFSATVGKGLYFFKKGFSPRRIHSLSIQSQENWNKETDQALSQTYTYIGRGRQCFAFASADGKYVVKLPRTDIYKIPLWARVLALPSIRERMRKDKAEREKFILTSFQIAYEDLQKQTGILAIHLGQSAPNARKLHLIDAIGCKCELPLAKTSFALQYKHPILMHKFEQALDARNRIEAEKILDALISAIAERAEKGILNRDRSFLRNYGYDGEKAYQIDIGSFFRTTEINQPAIFQKSVGDSMDAVKEWMEKKHPEMVPYITQKLEALNK